MFYSQFILAKKGPLGTIWIAAHLERKLRRNQVADTDIGVSVDSILFPEVPIALRLSSHLLLGVVRIYSRKVNYLFHDCSEALLKIKQAFRSTAVDLPPEESTAPYHSITLPETFHLDDFELPDSAFQGDYVDHHISTKEQITLQDNLEKTGFSTSKFGLDERFGDGNVSHVGLDLDEDLFLNKDQSAVEHSSIRLPSDEDGTFQHGQSSAAPTDMDLDQHETEFINTEKDDGLRANTDLSNWSGYNIQTPGYNIATPGYNIQTPAYNIQTPDLNEIFFSHGQGSNMEGPSVPATPFPDTPFHEMHSPETTDCAPPSTPGLMEETVLARVNDASPSVNYEDAPKADNNSTPFLQPCSVNGSAALTAASAEEKIGNEEGNENACKSAQEVALENSAEKSLPSVDAPNMNCEVSDLCVDQLGEMNQPVENGATHENASHMVNLNDAAADSTVDVLGADKGPDNITTNNLLYEQTPEQLQSKETPNVDKPTEASTTIEFSEPEKVLHAPEMDTASRADESGQVTVERALMEFDGSIDRSSSLIGQKRPLEDDSLLYLEKGSTERVSNRQRVRKSNNDFILYDDELLASILVGKRTPGLRLGPTPNKSSLLKRQKTTPKTSMHKRKVQLDDAMVLHADVIRQQLINTEDIRRLRKKAPCTRAEIWIIEKGPLEDEIFSESLFSGATGELSELQHQTYEIDISKPLRQLIRDDKGKELETEAPKVIIEEALDAPNPANAEDQGSYNAGTPYAYPVGSSLNNPLHGEPSIDQCSNIPETPYAYPIDLPLNNMPHGEPSMEPFYGLDNHNYLPEQQVENNNAVQPSDEVPKDLDKNDTTADIIHGNCGTPLLVTEGNLLDGGSGLTHVDEMKDEMDNLIEPKENPSTETGGVENLSDMFQGNVVQEGVCVFPDQQVGNDGNVTSVAGEQSGLQENNAGSFIDMESTVHNDFIPRECSDFCSAIEGVDTDFLNVDEEMDYPEEADEDAANPGDMRALDNSGWSSRTRGVARYLKLLFDEETGHGRKNVAIDHLLVGKSRKEASRMFFETLVLTTKDYIHVKQGAPFGLVNVHPGVKLMHSEF